MFELAWGAEGRGGREGETYQTQEMQPSVSLLGPFTSVEDRLVLMERPLLDRNVNPDDILPHHTSSSDVQVSSSET